MGLMSDRADQLRTALEPQDEDSSDLRWALETAIAMWLRGDRDQALRWTHSAVQTATSEGRHDRAYALGRVLGDMETQPMGGNAASTSLPAVLAPQAQSEHTAPMVEAPRTAASPGRGHKSMMQTAPYKIPPDEVTHLLEPDSQLLAACQASEGAPPTAPIDGALIPQVDSAPTPPRVARERPRPPTVQLDSLDATLTNVRPAPPSVSRDHVERTVVMEANDLMAPSQPHPSGPPTTLGSHQAVLEPMRALRVVIDAGSGREIVLRLLDADEAVPDGAQEAVLVPLPVKE